VVLASDPAPNAFLDRSPMVLRFDLSSALDPNSVLPVQDVFLTFNPTGQFGDGNDVDIPINQFNFSNAINELQLVPSAPLAPAYSQVYRGGDTRAGQPTLRDLYSISLETEGLHPSGQDAISSFQVRGVEGNPGVNATADDTAAGAHELGDLTQ